MPTLLHLAATCAALPWMTVRYLVPNWLYTSADHLCPLTALDVITAGIMLSATLRDDTLHQLWPQSQSFTSLMYWQLGRRAGATGLVPSTKTEDMDKLRVPNLRFVPHESDQGVVDLEALFPARGSTWEEGLVRVARAQGFMGRWREMARRWLVEGI